MSEINTENLLQTETEIIESTETVDSGTETVDSGSETVEETNDGTEIVEESTQVGSETLVSEPTDSDTLLSISNDVHLILVFTIITFVMSCFRGWRKNTLKGV